MTQENISSNSIIAFKTLDLNDEFFRLEESELEILDNILLKLANRHKRFTILTLKSMLEFLGVNTDFLLIVKDKELEHLEFNGRWLGTIDRSTTDRKYGFISIISRAIYDEIIPIDLEHIKERLK